MTALSLRPPRFYPSDKADLEDSTLSERMLSESAAANPARVPAGVGDGRAQLDRCRLEMLRGQHLVAIQGLEEALSQRDVAGRSPANEIRLLLALALQKVGDDARAKVLIDEASNDLGTAPVSLQTVPAHILLRRAKASNR